MPRTKYSNAILDNPKNGGLHSARTLKLVQEVFTTHDLKDAILYHVILSGKDSKAEYQATLKALVRNIRTKCKAEYIGGYEVGEEKGGLHAHAFVIVETSEHFPGNDVLNVSQGHWIDRRIKRTGMSIRIEPPKNPMHGGAMFARMNTHPKLVNCTTWATYALKKRSKQGVPGREKYFGSEFTSNVAKREAIRQKYRDALEKSSRPAAPQATPFLPIDPSMGRAEPSLTEKETQHDRNTTPPRGQTSPGHADSTSQGHTSTSTESPASGPILVGSRSRMRVQAPSASGPSTEAIFPGQAHGGATGPEHNTRSQVRHPGINHPNFRGVYFDQPEINQQNFLFVDSDSPKITHLNFQASYFDPIPTKGTALTPAARYIASKYENAVDLALDLEAMRRYLLERGIKRTPAAVVFDLNERYGFHGYAASHPAPPAMTLAAIDKSISRQYAQSRRLSPEAA